VELSLKQSVADSARAASAALQPVMQATMDGIAREVTALHGSVEHAVARQLEGLSSGFEASSAKVAEIWSESLSKHAQSSAALVGEMGVSLDRFTQAFDERATHLVEGVSAHMDRVSGGLEASVAKHEQSSDALVARMDASMAQFAQTFEARSSGLIDDVSARLETATGNMSQTWRDALEQHARTSEQSAAQNQNALTAAAASFERHAASLVQSVDRSHADLRVELAQHADERLATWSGALDTIAVSLREQWQQTSAVAADRQKDICDALAQTAHDMSAQSQAHASATIAEIERLVQAASEAPKAAAEVVAEMRQKLSDSMVRDTAMLDERSRLLATVETLLDAVNHASNEQRAAIDALVDTSATLLQRVGAQFTGTVETEAGKLGAMAAQVTASAVEMASLSDAFGAAVQSFGASNDKLVAHLERIESALDKSLARSDEQLAYYVAQAKEVIDLSMMSQKQIVEDLQHIAGQRVAGARAA
jgi:hypothetical protein